MMPELICKAHFITHLSSKKFLNPTQIEIALNAIKIALKATRLYSTSICDDVLAVFQSKKSASQAELFMNSAREIR
jgi:hypothetical protein